MYMYLDQVRTENTSTTMEEPFRPGTQVLAYHGPLVYEAKVLKYHECGKLFVEIGEGRSEPLDQNKIPKFLLESNAYYLHYKGWSPKWDEWVLNERIMEYNDDNLGLLRELRNARKKAIERIDHTGEKEEAREKRAAEKERKKRKAELKVLLRSSTPTGPKIAPKKRVKTDSRGAFDIMLPLRPRIKSFLVDDWACLTKDHKLVDLDTTVPVVQILADFCHYTEEQYPEADLRVLREAVDGLTVYFDHMLHLALLYRFERLQYSRLLAENSRLVPSQKYGVEHLLRLLCNMPGQVAQASMNTVSASMVLAHSKAIMEFVDDRLLHYKSRYMTASPAYDRLARGL